MEGRLEARTPAATPSVDPSDTCRCACCLLPRGRMRLLLLRETVCMPAQLRLRFSTLRGKHSSELCGRAHRVRGVLCGGDEKTQ